MLVLEGRGFQLDIVMRMADLSRSRRGMAVTKIKPLNRLTARQKVDGVLKVISV
jgi:hypothetical protein